MKLLVLFVAIQSACVVGDVDDDDDDIGAIASANPGDRLKWSSMTSNCTRNGHGMVANGQELSVLFDQGTRWRNCTFNATLRVPADVRLDGLTQFVRTAGTSSAIRYAAKVNGTQVTTKTSTARGTLQTYASVANLGDVLCRQPGGAYRYIQVAFQVSSDGTGVALDSIDWSFDASDCR
jgi:hypothetical protein